MSNTVVGIYERLTDARAAVQELVDRGFSMDKIDLSANEENIEVRDKEGMSKFFDSLFGSSSEEARTHKEAGYGGFVVTVHAVSRDEAERVADILDAHGAINPAATSRQDYKTTGYTGTGEIPATPPVVEKETTPPVGETSIPVIEEEMKVGKKEVEKGRVRVRSRIVERPVEESLRLRSEHVHIERTPVNRPASEADWKTFKEGEIEMTEHAEEPVVSKESRVVEEVKLKKDVEEHEEKMRGRVKRQDVEVDEKKKERKP